MHRDPGSVDPATDAWVKTVCEECGQPAAFPAELRDTTQRCPSCGAHVDVSADAPPATSACPANPRRHSIGGMIVLGTLGLLLGMELGAGVSEDNTWARVGIGLACAAVAGLVGLKMRFG